MYDYQTKHHAQRMRQRKKAHQITRLFDRTVELRAEVDSLPEQTTVRWRWWHWFWLPKERL